MPKRRIALGLVCVLLGLNVWAQGGSDNPTDTVKATKVRVGTFDSRAVAMANFGKMIEEGWCEKLYAEHKKAKAAGKEKLAAELAEKGEAQQKRLHMQVFGTAPVPEGLKRIKKELPELARSASVDVIVCIHDVVYRSPSVEFVDITDQMVQLFDPDEETLKKIEGLLKHPPFPQEVLENMKCHPPEKSKRDGETSDAGIRIGVYDSRVVAFAYWWDEKRMNSYHDSLTEGAKKAKAAGDDKRAKELEAELWAHRKLLHKQIFSTEPIDDVLERIKDKLDEIARHANVSALVSKWDKKSLKRYESPELVDVTDLIVEQFNLDEKRLRMIEQVKSERPIPLRKLEKMMAAQGH